MDNNSNITNIILKIKKKILSRKKHILCKKNKKEQNMPNALISSYITSKNHKLRLKEAYIIIKKDKNIKMLEKKFNIILKKEDIVLL